MEVNLLDALGAVAHSLIFVSLVYFLYLVIRFGHLSDPAGDADGCAGEPAPYQYIAAWRGEIEHGLPGKRAFRLRDSA